MIRICKWCGQEYDGKPGSVSCPACVKAHRSTTLAQRTCIDCGVSFTGGPRARRCPDCRAVRARQVDAALKRNGPKRKLGSIDHCTVCGAEYIVEGGRQRYCKACADAATKAAQSADSLARYYRDDVRSQRAADRKKADAQIRCVICGSLFTPHDPSTTCSRECSAALGKRNASQWEADHKDYRKQYRRDLAARKSAEAEEKEEA